MWFPSTVRVVEQGGARNVFERAREHEHGLAARSASHNINDGSCNGSQPAGIGDTSSLFFWGQFLRMQEHCSGDSLS